MLLVQHYFVDQACNSMQVGLILWGNACLCVHISTECLLSWVLSSKYQRLGERRDTMLRRLLPSQEAAAKVEVCWPAHAVHAQ